MSFQSFNPSTQGFWWTAIATPPWLNNSAVSFAWQSFDKYMTYSGGAPHVASWGPQRGAVSLVPFGGTVDLVNTGFGKWSSMNAGIFDGDAAASALSGTATPFSCAVLMTTVGVGQGAGRFGFAFGNSSNTTSLPLGLAFTGTNNDFIFSRKNDAGTLKQGGTISLPGGRFRVVEAHFNGSTLDSFLDGAAKDVAAPFEPGGTTTANTFCLNSYRGSGGRSTASTARFAAFLFTGGSVWNSATKSRVREYMTRLASVTS